MTTRLLKHEIHFSIPQIHSILRKKENDNVSHCRCFCFRHVNVKAKRWGYKGKYLYGLTEKHECGELMVKTTLEVDDDLWRRFSILVLREKGERKKNEVITKLIKDYVERSGFTEDPQQLKYILQVEEERETFHKVLNKLIQDPRYKGKYVAFFQGTLVGCDEDKGKLAESLYEKYGYVPIYIDRVAIGERHVEVPSPELTRREV